MAFVTPVINSTLVIQAARSYQPCFQQRTNQQNQQNRAQRPAQFNLIPIIYTKLFPALIHKNLVQTRTPPFVAKELPWWYKTDQHCAFHQGAPCHDNENCFTLKAEVRRLMQSGILSFEDSNPNVQVNSLPKHGNTTVNMVEGCPEKYDVFDVNLIRRSLVEMHAALCELRYYEHDHDSCHVCSRDPRGCIVVKRDLPEMLDQNLIQVTRDRNEGEHEASVIIPRFNIPEPVVIAYNGKKYIVSLLVIRLAGRTPYESDKVIPYKYNATMVEHNKEVHIPSFSAIVNIFEVSGVTRSGQVFVVAAPKMTEDVVIEKSTQEKALIIQLGQSNSVNQNVDQDEMLKLIKKSHFNAVDQLLHNLSKIYVLSLLMSSEAHREALQKVLEKAYMDHNMTIDQFNGIVANITACTPMRFSGVVVKVFDGSRKTVIGEVDLPIKIEAKVYEEWKVSDMGGKQAMLVSHLSSFSYIDADEAEGTLFQALSVDNIIDKKNGESMSSLKDAQHVLKNDQSTKWGQIFELPKNRNISGFGFSPGETRRDLNRIQEVFHSSGFNHSKDHSAAIILEDDEEQGVSNFVTRGSICQN
ncbi:uncharacterized protein LOC127123744 [Lathyrus oleraceus]|uniref:uncharacterized protein LOC127123744 n=1 Tax=Pisum sativum TaxID=3888 RepID=UPI0021D078D5|nr:uncharacterized protein LOC127123744 [Pisum sativum]